jgi:hypothetical protein
MSKSDIEMTLTEAGMASQPNASHQGPASAGPAELDEPWSPWRPISTAPLYTQIMLADISDGNRSMYIGVIFPRSGPGRATHWMPMPTFPNA